MASHSCVISQPERVLRTSTPNESRNVNITKKIAAAIIAGSLTMAAAPAMAQDSSTPAEQSATDHGAEREARHEVRIAALAEKLGMEPAAFEDAITAVKAALEGSFDDDTTREERRAAFAAAFAEETGIPAEDFVAAHQELRAERQAERLANLKTRLEEKVAAGEMTQEKADEIYASAEAGDFKGRGGRGGPEGRQGERGERGERGPRGDRGEADGSQAA
jgi:transcription termination factor Rho